MSLSPCLIRCEVFYEIILGWVIYIVFQDKVGSCFEELDNFPGKLGLHWFFHSYLLSRVCVGRLCFEAFYLEDDVGVDGAFLIEHGVSEGGFGHGADFPGDAERDLMNAIKGLFIEDGLFCAGQFKVMSDIVFALIEAQ